jgi:hypothetical protein
MKGNTGKANMLEDGNWRAFLNAKIMEFSDMLDVHLRILGFL